MGFLNSIDLPILRFVNSFLMNPFFDSVMPIITNLGSGGLIWIITATVMIITKKYRKYGVAALISLAVCFVTGNYMIKPLVGRVRPCNAVDIPFAMLVPRMYDFSFPSMHTATSFSCAVVFLFADKKIGISAIILALLIGFSRIYLNLHYASDVFFGIVYGFFIALITIKLWHLICKKRI